MADDNAPKIASIDELVNELTKKPTTPPPPASGAFQAPKPNPTPEIPKPRFTPPPPPSAVPPRPVPSPAGGPPAPSPAPAKPPVPPAPQPSGAGPVKEYQSSIRTMKEDITTLKQGQKPAGVEVPRKVGPPVPPPAGGVPPGPKIIPPPAPSGQFKMPSVGLGQAEKAAPLPQEKRAPAPPSPAGRPAPIPPKIYAPPLPTGGTAGGRNRLFMLIAGAAVLFGVLYWFLVLRTPVPGIVEESPTSTVIPSETPTPDLNSIFTSLRSEELSAEDQNFQNIQISGGEFVRLKTPPLIISNLLKNPESASELGQIFGVDSVDLAYGQKEKFDDKGNVKINAPIEKRLVSVTKLTDPSLAVGVLSKWEPSMTEYLAKVFGLDAKKAATPGFLDNSYKGAAIRYRNFAYADRSIDYAVVPASNGQSYLVLANSREAMFAAIDKLKSPVPSRTPIIPVVSENNPAYDSAVEIINLPSPARELNTEIKAIFGEVLEASKVTDFSGENGIQFFYVPKKFPKSGHRDQILSAFQKRGYELVSSKTDVEISTVSVRNSKYEIAVSYSEKGEKIEVNIYDISQ